MKGNKQDDEGYIAQDTRGTPECLLGASQCLYLGKETITLSTHAGLYLSTDAFVRKNTLL